MLFPIFFHFDVSRGNKKKRKINRNVVFSTHSRHTGRTFHTCTVECTRGTGRGEELLTPPRIHTHNTVAHVLYTYNTFVIYHRMVRCFNTHHTRGHYNGLARLCPYYYNLHTRARKRRAKTQLSTFTRSPIRVSTYWLLLETRYRIVARKKKLIIYRIVNTYDMV